jgi:hypothetical protein
MRLASSLVEALTVLSMAEETFTESEQFLAASSLLVPFSERFPGRRPRNMIIPSLLTWVVGAAMLIVASLPLRYLANEAHELTRSRGRASVAPALTSSSTYRKAA